MIVLRDVTEELQMNEARELITETLVHDLRSPMSSVLGQSISWRIRSSRNKKTS